MDGDERLLGELMEFKRVTMTRLDQIDAKVDELRGFHWKVAGGVGLLVFLAKIVFH